VSVEPHVIAVDLDGTLYDGRTAHPEAIDALRHARDAGHTVVIVTGRPWRDLDGMVPTLVEIAACAVCEDGAVLIDVSTAAAVLLAEPPRRALIDALETGGVVGLVLGEVAIGMPVEHAEIARKVVEQIGAGFHLVHNKNSVAIIPDGCHKGTGLAHAIAHLGLSGTPVLAIGDAANDLPMFRYADVAGAVANADALVREAGIELTELPGGAGVAEAIRRYLAVTIRAG
jgi:hydroxymethylpyrimidine pyrophosphatase-like HAD family hydrolase